MNSLLIKFGLLSTTLDIGFQEGYAGAELASLTVLFSLLEFIHLSMSTLSYLNRGAIPKLTVEDTLEAESILKDSLSLLVSSYDHHACERDNTILDQ